MRLRRNRKVAAAAAAVLTTAILVTGTYAWRSISQEALNEIRYIVNPGGRLHDDFDGVENKDVYAENFTGTKVVEATKDDGTKINKLEEDSSGAPLYVRIRLDEYMELGEDAGEDLENENRNVTAEPLISGTKSYDKTTWTTYIPGQSDVLVSSNTYCSQFREYWSWVLGGSTVYMPTFNKDKDSLEADYNGTWDGKSPSDDQHYDDHYTYTLGEEKVTNAVYDNDDDDLDNGGTTTVTNEQHFAAETLAANVWSMEYWKNQGCPVTNVWVWDTDGWAYWAAPLQPGEATGLLLNGIEKENSGKLDKDCYYAINVVAQFATRSDLQGSSTGNGLDGFYCYNGDNELKGATEDAVFLLNQAANKEYKVTVEPKEAENTGAEASTQSEEETTKTLTLNPGDEQQFVAKVTCMGEPVYNQSVKWSIVGNHSKDTKIDSNGTLVIAEDEITSDSESEAESDNSETQTSVSGSVTEEQSDIQNGSKLASASWLTIRATDKNNNIGVYYVKVTKQEGSNNE